MHLVIVARRHRRVLCKLLLINKAICFNQIGKARQVLFDSKAESCLVNYYIPSLASLSLANLLIEYSEENESHFTSFIWLVRIYMMKNAFLIKRPPIRFRVCNQPNKVGNILPHVCVCVIIMDDRVGQIWLLH